MISIHSNNRLKYILYLTQYSNNKVIFTFEEACDDDREPSEDEDDIESVDADNTCGKKRGSETISVQFWVILT